MKSYLPFLTILLSLVMFSCASDKKVENASAGSAAEIEQLAEEEAIASNVSGYASIDELSVEVISSIKANDYQDYVNHVMTKEMEETVAQEINKKDMRDHFRGEFGFSLDREQQEFSYMQDYLKERKINLDSIKMDEIEVVDYHHDEYTPLNLKEVIITIPHDYDVLLIYVAIEIRGRWYLTSDLEI